jgi:hypothetical protein
LETALGRRVEGADVPELDLAELVAAIGS